MSKAKDNQKSNKITSNRIKTETQIAQEPKIALRYNYLTTNKHYNMHYFNNKSMKLNAHDELMAKLIEITGSTISHISSIGKEKGAEPIPYSSLKENLQDSLKNIEIVSKGATFTVFRFCQQNYRLICLKDAINKNILHIIGFDFDYSAYAH
ncbi:MAG: hypothetical protein FWD23_08425 [Oscillospiraceae bacterium]|nr:hypothetical protein [Oscillospiraceae bacterium]